jgi:hypothetical protein
MNRRGWLSWLGSAILISIPLLVGSSIGYVFFIASISHHLGSWEWIFWSVLSYAFLALISGNACSGALFLRRRLDRRAIHRAGEE